MLLHKCIVHEPDAHGRAARQEQTISLVDVTRIRVGRPGNFETFIGGRWLEIEGNIDEFRTLWERAKASATRAS